jgi:integrase/recombinase XerD
MNNDLTLTSAGFTVVTATELQITLVEFKVSLQGYSERTVKAYLWNLNRLIDWLHNRGVKQPSQLTRLLLREWATGLYTNWGNSTVKQAISATKCYLKWCKSERLISEDLAAALKTPKEKQRVQRTITIDEVRKMIDACDTGTLIGLRDRAIVSLLFDSGLRAAELCRLRIQDIDLEEKEFKVIIKGGNELPGWFGEKTKSYLAEWIAVRWGMHSILFPSIGGNTPGEKLTTNGLCKALNKLGNRAGVKDVNTHAFRRGFAVHLQEMGVPDSVLMDFGRWNDVKMIRRYTAARQAKRLYQKHSPMDSI